MEVPELQEPPTNLFLRSILQRKAQPLTEPLKLNVQVHGIYSVPELWKSKMVSRPLQVGCNREVSVGRAV